MSWKEYIDKQNNDTAVDAIVSTAVSYFLQTVFLLF